MRERGVSTGKSEHDRVAAHFRVVICVSLRMAASAEAPSSPMLLDERLQQARGGMGGNGETVGVSTGVGTGNYKRYGAAAHSSEATELPLSASHRLMMPTKV